MHLLRITASLLTTSLLTSVLMIGAFHSQREIEPHADHAMAHVDSIVTGNKTVALASPVEESSCHLDTQQATIAQVPNQSTFSVQLGATPPTRIFASDENRMRWSSSAFIGRNPPLFEHASLYAATVAMRS